MREEVGEGGTDLEEFTELEVGVDTVDGVGVFIDVIFEAVIVISC